MGQRGLMGIYSDGNCPIRKHVALKRNTNRMICEKAFTLVELMVTLIVIGFMIGISVLIWDGAASSMDVQSAAEMLKEDIGRVYVLAASGTPNVSNGIGHRDQYRLQISTSNGTPPNCYKISKRTWTGSSWDTSWTDITTRNAQANRISGGWIKPGSVSNLSIDILDSGGGPMNIQTYDLILESKGSIIHVMNSTGTAEAIGDLVIRLKSTSKTVNVTVSVLGNVSLRQDFDTTSLNALRGRGFKMCLSPMFSARG